METFDMKEFGTMLDGIVLLYSKGLSEENIDNLFGYYIQQIKRIKNLLKTDKQNKEKYDQLCIYIKILKEMSNENIHLKNHIEYENSISKNF
jgi:hypothetical protein